MVISIFVFVSTSRMVGRLVHAFTHVFTSTTVLYMVGKGEYGHMVLPSSLINRSIKDDDDEFYRTN